MGSREKNLTWSWSLISVEWIPDILSSLGTLIEPSWIGLRRAMTAKTVNRSFANHIFSQLKTFLNETELVQDAS